MTVPPHNRSEFRSVIRPIIPTEDSLPAGSSYPLVDINLAFGKIDLVYTFEGALNIEVLKLALAHSFGRMRTTCGRYAATRGEDRRYVHEMVLTDLPVSFLCVIYSSKDPDVPTPVIPSSAVVQPAAVLAPFLHPLPQPSPSLKVEGHPVAEDGELLRVQYSEVERTGSDQAREIEKSVLGITWGHIIGDADLASQFTAMLSAIYIRLLDLDPSARLVPTAVSSLSLPKFTTRHVTFPSPSSKIQSDRWLLQAIHTPRGRSAVWYARAFAIPSEAVTITLSESELQAIKRVVQAGCGEGEWVSAQDALTAWWVQLLRAIEPERKIERVINTISYRSFHPGSDLFPFDLTHTVGNVVQMSAIRVPPDSSMTQTALGIRRDITTYRTSLSDCRDWLGNAAYGYRDSHDGRSQIYFLPDPCARKGEEAIVNSNLRYDWVGGAIFSFARDKVAYHTSFGALRFLRVFRPNARALPEGEDGPGAELSFLVLEGQTVKVDRWLSDQRSR